MKKCVAIVLCFLSLNVVFSQKITIDTFIGKAIQFDDEVFLFSEKGNFRVGSEGKLESSEFENMRIFNSDIKKCLAKKNSEVVLYDNETKSYGRSIKSSFFDKNSVKNVERQGNTFVFLSNDSLFCNSFDNPGEIYLGTTPNSFAIFANQRYVYTTSPERVITVDGKKECTLSEKGADWYYPHLVIKSKLNSDFETIYEVKNFDCDILVNDNQGFSDDAFSDYNFILYKDDGTAKLFNKDKEIPFHRKVRYAEKLSREYLLCGLNNKKKVLVLPDGSIFENQEFDDIRVNCEDRPVESAKFITISFENNGKTVTYDSSLRRKIDSEYDSYLPIDHNNVIVKRGKFLYLLNDSNNEKIGPFYDVTYRSSNRFEVLTKKFKKQLIDDRGKVIIGDFTIKDFIYCEKLFNTPLYCVIDSDHNMTIYNKDGVKIGNTVGYRHNKFGVSVSNESWFDLSVFDNVPKSVLYDINEHKVFRFTERTGEFGSKVALVNLDLEVITPWFDYIFNIGDSNCFYGRISKQKHYLIRVEN